MKSLIFMLCLLFAVPKLFAEASIVAEGVDNPGAIYTDGSQLYITDKVQLLIYSLPDIKPVSKFGTKGEGPKEFLPPYGEDIGLDILPDQLMVISLYKISYFSKKGEYLSEQKIPTNILTNRTIRKVGENFFGSTITRGNKEEKFRIMISYNLYAPDFSVKKEIYRVEQGYEGPRTKLPLNPIYMTLFGPCLFREDGKIFLGHYGQQEQGKIYVFDKDGNKLYDINPPYEKVKFTEKDREAYLGTFITSEDKDFYETNKHLFNYEEYFPLRQSFYVSDGKIYVQTFKKSKDKSKTQFLILNLKGELIKTLMVPLKYQDYFTPFKYSISKGKLYQIVENNDEDWEILVQDIL